MYFRKNALLYCNKIVIIEFKGTTSIEPFLRVFLFPIQKKRTLILKPQYSGHGMHTFNYMATISIRKHSHPKKILGLNTNNTFSVSITQLYSSKLPIKNRGAAFSAKDALFSLIKKAARGAVEWQ